MAENEEEKITYVFIPSNIQENISFNGMSIEPVKLLEACIGAFLGGFIMKKITDIVSVYFIYKTESKIAWIIFFAVVFGVIGFIGANNESFSQFVKHAVTFRKRKRIAYYNARVKNVKPPMLSDDDVDNRSGDMVVRDKVRAWMSSYKESMSERNAEKIRAVENGEMAGTGLYFEDDVGVVDPPEAYMTKEFKKKKKKEAKAEAKRLKAEAKASLNKEKTRTGKGRKRK